MKTRKYVIFEKKNQKTFDAYERRLERGATAESKFFCFFFSKKKALLAYDLKPLIFASGT